MKKITKIIFLGILFCISLKANENIKNIILISSYHSSLKWDIDLTKELTEKSKKYKNIQIFKENLDAIRFGLKNNIVFYNYIKEKYKNIQIDAIITDSDPAFEFIEDYGLELFGDIPFTSYTHNRRISTFTNRVNISNEEQIKATFSYALKQNPETTTVIIIDQENSQSTSDILRRFNDKISIRDISNFSLKEIIKFTSSINHLSFIFYVSYFKEPLGEEQDPISVLNKIYKESNIPIYSFNPTYLDHGVIGGSIIDIEKLATTLLKSTLGINEKKSNIIDISTTLFNKELTEKFKIDIQKESSREVIKEEINFDYFSNLYPELKKEIIIIITVFAIMVFLLLFTLYLSYSRKNLINKLKKQNENIKKDRFEKNQTDKILVQQSKMAALGEMLQNISHQWRQPLSVISTSASGIKVNRELDMVDEKFELESLDKILESTQYLSKTIDVFRNFFKPSNAKEFFSISSAIDQVIYLSNIESNSYYNIDIQTDINDVSISSYKNELIQALLNIMNNSKDALMQNIDEDSKKLILITVYQRQNNAIISIKDNAGGIKEENLHKIFQPYFTTKHQSKGTGIGLYMTNEIITKHMRGRIIVKNTTFTFNKKEYFGADFSIYIPSKF